MKLLKIKCIQRNKNESYLKKNYEFLGYKNPRTPRSNKYKIKNRKEEMEIRE